MATTSAVKAGLDEIAFAIRTQRTMMEQAKAKAAGASTALDSIPSGYADVIATIQAYASDTTDQFELLSKAELAKLTTEFIALKAHADAVAGLDLDS